ncbi:MAG: hypothetical protein M0R06_03125 [Sphaerochaeta sp.]|jgi:hypothetical protein|nr:hypothetical protein [Sphaerochaeta sp.]
MSKRLNDALSRIRELESRINKVDVSTQEIKRKIDGSDGGTIASVNGEMVIYFPGPGLSRRVIDLEQKIDKSMDALGLVSVWIQEEPAHWIIKKMDKPKKSTSTKKRGK